MDAAITPDIAQVAWRRRRALAVVTIAAGVAGVLITWLCVPRSYSATAQVLYESNPAPLLSARALVGQDAETRGAMMVAVLRSRTFGLRVIEKYDLVTRLEADSPADAAEHFRTLFRASTAAGGVLRMRMSLTGSVRGIISEGEDEETAKLAADIIDTLIQQLRKYLEESNLQETRRQLQTVEAELADVEEVYREAVDNVIAFQQESGIISPSAQLQNIYGSLSQVEKMLAETRAELRSAETMYSMAAVDDDSARALAASRSPAIQVLLAKLYKNQVSLTNALTVEKKLPSHPHVQALQTSIDETKAQLAGEIDIEDAARAVTVAATRARLRAVEHVREQLTGKLPRFTSGSVVHDDLLNQVALQAARRMTLYEQLAQARSGAEGDKIVFTVLDAPLPPTKRSGPSTVLNCVGAMAAAFVLAVAIFFFADVTRPQLMAAPPAPPDN